MTQVLQQRCSPVGMAQQSYTAPPFRSDSMLANQSKDHSASGVSGLLAASNMETVSSTDSPLPTYDLAPMLALKNGDQSETIQQLCQAVANCLHDTGCLVIRDPRVKIEDNMAFLDMMERYFAQSTAAKMRDTRPDLHFQVSMNILRHFACSMQASNLSDSELRVLCVSPLPIGTQLFCAVRLVLLPKA